MQKERADKHLVASHCSLILPGLLATFSVDRQTGICVSYFIRQLYSCYLIDIYNNYMFYKVFNNDSSCKL